MQISVTSGNQPSRRLMIGPVLSHLRARAMALADAFSVAEGTERQGLDDSPRRCG
jgi:hypothetical protein